jgi:hypothetical protein
MKLEEIIKTGVSRIETIKVRTALNPLLWLTGLTLPTCVVATVAISDQIVRLVLLGLAAFSIIVTIVAYFILLFRDPDRLQSEEYRIRQRALQILYKKGTTADIVEFANDPPRLEIEKRTQEDER